MSNEEIERILAEATTPSELNPEPVEPPDNAELALRISELRGDLDALKAKFEKLCGSLNVR